MNIFVFERKKIQQWKKFIYCLLCLTFAATFANAEEYQWSDYRQPFNQTAHVFQYGMYKKEWVTITVNIPEDFIKNRENITLVITINSRTDCGNGDAFGCFRPYIYVNSTMFNTYNILVKSNPERQIQEVKIKTKHLKAGQNTIKAAFNWNESGWGCSATGCGYEITNLSFKEASSLSSIAQSKPTALPKLTATPRPKPTPTSRPTPLPTITPVQRNTPAPIAVTASSKRVALLIGNARYKDMPLSNPVNDVRAIESSLKRLGFDILKYENVTQREMKQAIDSFGQKLKTYEVGLFYYSGHGVQVKGENYLIPIDANPQSENDVEYDCVSAGRILAKMEDAGSSTNIIILDACRSNPFEKSWTKSAKGQGLAFMNAPSGSLIAYATSPGNVAFDDPNKTNSPYTAALLRFIEIPGISVLEMFQRVRVAVEENTNRQQTPWESTSLRSNFYFK